MTWEQRPGRNEAVSHVNFKGKHILGRVASRCKGPVAQACLGKIREVSVIWQTSQQERDTRAGDGVKLINESMPLNKLSFILSKMQNH